MTFHCITKKYDRQGRCGIALISKYHVGERFVNDTANWGLLLSRWTADLRVTVGLIFKNTGRTYFVDERSSTLVKKHIGQP